ncbi:methyltransferase family protein [Bacteroidota bacterium]
MCKWFDLSEAEWSLITLPFNLIGIAFIFIGLQRNHLSSKEMEKYKTPHSFEKTTKLVDKGVFNYTRNQMYLGMTSGLIGIALLFQNIFGFISPLTFFLIMEFKFIPYENKKLMEEIG